MFLVEIIYLFLTSNLNVVYTVGVTFHTFTPENIAEALTCTLEQ